MHAAEEHVGPGPGAMVGKGGDERRPVGGVKIVLKVQMGAFDVKARAGDGGLEGLPGGDVGGDKGNGAANAVRPSRPQRYNLAAPGHDRWRHHRGQAGAGGPVAGTAGIDIVLAQHVVHQKSADQMTVALAIGDRGRRRIALPVNDADMGRAPP